MCLKRQGPYVTDTETLQYAARHQHAIAHTFLLNQSHGTDFTHVIHATNHKQLATSRHQAHENSENSCSEQNSSDATSEIAWLTRYPRTLLLCWTHKSRLSEGTKAIAFQLVAGYAISYPIHKLRRVSERTKNDGNMDTITNEQGHGRLSR